MAKSALYDLTSKVKHREYLPSHSFAFGPALRNYTSFTRKKYFFDKALSFQFYILITITERIEQILCEKIKTYQK